MRLKSVRMVGFKSFADETLIEVRDGITAIVGPNGCGKSNILDAVRWVLGEKSAKGLRAKNMDDVIFLGSEFRKSAGMAEVEMAFDNTDRSLPLEMDEVSVGRRIYLNSGSEYLLNGRRTTRREIEKVFMDTGIGKAAYSIMEQGRMSEILRASPEERRGLFDEAAGVSRFKAERQETLARLSDTEQNLLRLGDILKSKEDELKSLDRQARKTREYLKLKEYLDTHDKNLRYLKHTELEEKRTKADEKLKSLLEKRDEIFKRISSSEEQTVAREAESAGRLEEMHRLDRDYHQALAGLESLKKSVSRMDGEKRERLAKVESLEKRRGQEEKAHREIKRKMEQSQQLELDLNTELKALEGTGEKIRLSIEEGEAGLRASHEKEEANKVELGNIEDEQAQLLEELKNIARELIEDLDSRKRELAGSENRRGELRDGILGRLDEGRDKLARALENLKSGSGDAAAEIASIDLEAVKKDFTEYESIESEFRSFLFGRSGFLAKKEEIDQRLDRIVERREALQKETAELLENRKTLIEEQEQRKQSKIDLDLRIRDSQVRRESQAETREATKASMAEAEDRLKYYSQEIEEAREELKRLGSEAVNLEKEMREIEAANKEQVKKIEAIKKEVEGIRAEIDKLRDGSRKDRESIEKILPAVSEQERRAESIAVALGGLEEDLYNDYQLSLGELAEQCGKLRIQKDKEESSYRRIKAEIQALGQFNPLAIEELDRSQEAYDEILKQQKDIEKARENIMKVLKEIDDRSRERFTDTFERIQNNFTEVFTTLFGGGNAALTLTEPEDPLNSGVEIFVQPPGKKNSMISLLSGGEQSLTAIALMFATYLVRPSPFCFLDEIDAPLDDTNVVRFLRMLDRFAGRSQFLVITHNKLTMAQAVGIFGVTQEERGVSKLVSVQLREAEEVVG